MYTIVHSLCRNNLNFVTSMIHLIENREQYHDSGKADRLHSFKQILAKENFERTKPQGIATAIGNTQLMRQENGSFGPLAQKTGTSKDKNMEALENHSRGFPAYLPDLDCLRGTVQIPTEETELLMRFFDPKDENWILCDSPFVTVPSVETFPYYFKHVPSGSAIYCKPGIACNLTALINLTGTYLRPLEPVDKYRIVQFLAAKDFRARRLDICVLTLKEDGLMDRLYHCLGERKIKGIRVPGRFIKDMSGEGGDTLELNSRTSEKFYRCYDTKVKRHHEGECLELELKHRKAKAFWLLLVEVTPYPDGGSKLDRIGNEDFAQKWHSFLGNYLFGGITPYDWIDVGANRRIKEIAICDWWLDLQAKCEAATPMTIYVGTPAKSVRATTEWHIRQVAKSLAIVTIGFGQDVYDEYHKYLLENGSDRLNDRDAALIELFKAERDTWKRNFDLAMAA